MANRTKSDVGPGTTSKPKSITKALRGDAVTPTADFMADLRRQEAAGIEIDIAAGRLVSSDELCRRLNLSKDALATALMKSQIFAVTDSLGNLHFPAFFGEPEKYPLVALEKVCMALGDLSGKSKRVFFLTPLLTLDGETPLDALAKGKIEAVTNAAAAFSEMKL
jgi:hypothetical protein